MQKSIITCGTKKNNYTYSAAYKGEISLAMQNNQFSFILQDIVICVVSI